MLNQFGIIMCNTRILVALFAFIFIHDGGRKFVASEDTVMKDKNTSSSTVKDGENPPYDLRLSELEPFGGQLAGHVYDAHHEKKIPKLVLMKDSDGNLLKPLPTQSEIDFYENLYHSEDETLKQIKELVPAYFGVKRVLVNEEEGKVVKFIHLENVMKNYELPCSMDVKLGLVRIPPGTVPRTFEQEERYKATMTEWGFGIPGFSYFNLDGVEEKKGKEFGYNMTLDQAVDSTILKSYFSALAFYNFMQKQVGIKCKLVEEILSQLQKIYNLYGAQNHFLLYDSSVLLTYDAKGFVDHFKKYSDYKQAIAELNCDRVNVPVRVCMLDFGKTDFKTGVPVEERLEYESYLRADPENYLRGVRNLILLLEHLDFHWAASTFKSK